MIGEVRDKETAQISVEAALTVHLCSARCTRMTPPGAPAAHRDGVEPFLSASAIVGILRQRLARRLCPECRVKPRCPHKVLMRSATRRRFHAGSPTPRPIYEAEGHRVRRLGLQGPPRGL